jgi:hypothetical protein
VQAKPLTIFFKAFRDWRKYHPVYGEIARGWLRALLAVAGPILAAILMISLFEPVTLKEAVRSLQENALLSRLPYLVVMLSDPSCRRNRVYFHGRGQLCPGYFPGQEL